MKTHKLLPYRLFHMPSMYKMSKVAYQLGKIVTFKAMIGAENAVKSFVFINGPIFLMTFGSDTKSSPETQADVIIPLGKSLGTMQLIRNIGEAMSPIFCEKEYAESCKALSRVAGFAAQTWMLNQTAAAGVVKGLSYERFGDSLPAVVVSESLAGMTSPIFIALNKINPISVINESNITKLVKESTAGLAQGIKIAPYIYAAIQCSFLPIVTSKLPNPFDTTLCAALITQINPLVVYNTTKALIDKTLPSPAYNTTEDLQNNLLGNHQDNVCFDS